MRASAPRRPKKRHVFAIILVSVAAGYAFAITVAKAGAPKQTVYELPHDFTLNESTFLPSALPGAVMTSGNRLQLLENGDAIFSAMLAAIASARKTVNFEAYIFWSDEVGKLFRDALAERATHGVGVRVLLDAIGSSGGHMKAGDVDVLRHAGCHVEFFHSMKPWMLWVFNHRNHRRVLVVDGTLGFTGSVGFADSCRGAMGIAGGLWRVETRVTPSVSFSIPPGRRAFCPGGSPSRRTAAVGAGSKKPPEGRSRWTANGSGDGRGVMDARTTTKSRVHARRRAPQFPLHPDRYGHVRENRSSST